MSTTAIPASPRDLSSVETFEDIRKHYRVHDILRDYNVDITDSSSDLFPDINPVDIYRAHLVSILHKLLPDLPIPTLRNAIHWTQTLDNGDLSIPVAALRVKDIKPADLAQKLAADFPPSPLIHPPTAVGIFLRIFFKELPLLRLTLPAILYRGENYGFNPYVGLRDITNPAAGRKRIIVEFSSPNIAKPFHAGHLRSTIIGGFIANLYQGHGWDVIRLNYLGDWGKQYGVLAVGFERYGSEQNLLANPIGHLYDVYVQISKLAADEADLCKSLEQKYHAAVNGTSTDTVDIASIKAQIDKINETGVDASARAYFKRMVDGDEDALSVWRKFRNLSIQKYRDTYARLNINFDNYSGESQVSEGRMKTATRIMQDQGLLEDSDGAVIIDLSKHEKRLAKAVVRKKDGTSLYLTRDVGALLERFETYKFDKMIYVVASQQDLHLAQLFKIVELMGYPDVAQRCSHINFGMVLGMSTRRGTAKFLDDILRDVGEKMHDVMRTNEAKYREVADPEKTSDLLGISAVMVQDMTGKRIHNYEFDMDRMCSFEGDTGPYLQYAHARLSSIIRRVDKSFTIEELACADFSLLSERHASDLVRSLAQWPDVVSNSLRTLEPITILTYLFRMTHLLSSSYDHLHVVSSKPDVLRARLALYTAARQVLRNGMRLLGLTPVDRM